ncbi:hypothetical protein JGS39_38570 [Streptomyces sp. P01-B04]|uniref:hypothetical protein n=1 Tax=Streptomyces poriferorum TaxID=2798799 RepID=UPI001C5E1257|nr:hypothetical protein [Streptomyces poriferorum]MBW5254789.1 hypothetical protein [Streptomyces poriferorum]MBW5259996.1 hypothetical protein [Streptomyces poriferorum]
MQDTEHGTSPEEAPEAAAAQEAAAAAEAIQAALSGRRPADARARATAALERYGPDPLLYTLLGRAHVAENEDDHDDAAERVYRRGLDAFPDDLGLLTAYAELCLESDALDRPGRHARGPGLVARVGELAPDSAYVRRLDRISKGIGGIMAATGGGRPSLATPIPLSAAHTQRHDVRTALTTAPNLAEATRLAAEESQQYPYDLRWMIRAETLAALGRPGRRLLVAQVRAPILLVPLALALGALAMIPRSASPLSLWAGAAALLVFLPNRLLGALESRARTRAASRLQPPPADRDPLYSLLPPPPAPGARDAVALVAAVALGFFALVSPSWLVTSSDTDDPHTTASAPAPASFRGQPLLSAQPAVDGLDSEMAGMWTNAFDTSFAYLYGSMEQLASYGAQPAAYVFGSTGDRLDAPPAVANGTQLGLTESDAAIDDTWDAGPGTAGGRLRCASYASDTEEKGAHTACSWTDSRSYGTIVLNEPGLDHETAAAAAREMRDAILQGETVRGDA